MTSSSPEPNPEGKNSADACWSHPSLSSRVDFSQDTFFGKLSVVLEMIKFRHSVFALPFALLSMFTAARGMPSFWTFFWIVAACVAARSMAMSYNRLVDRELDARNPRTQSRALPAGLVGEKFTRWFVVASGGVFLFSAAMLNALCFLLAPIIMVILLGYSHCKRWTVGAHWVLGASLGLAPAGAWIAVTGGVAGLPVFLMLGVLLWVAGFDIIYACLDVEVDRREGLFALPARVGVAPALRGAALLHVFSVVFFALFLAENGFGWAGWIALALSAALLVQEHRMVRPHDLSRVGPAFFTFNAIISIVFFTGCVWDIFAG